MKKLIGLMAVLGLVSAVAFAQENGAAPATGDAGGAPAADSGAPAKHHGGKKGKGKHKHGKKKETDSAGAAGGASQ